MEMRKNEKANTKSHYRDCRELSADELLMVGGGDGEGDGDGDGGGDVAGSVGCMAADNSSPTGMSVTDGISLGSVAGGVAGLGAAVTGTAGLVAAGDLMAAGTVLGGLLGAIAVGTVALGSAAVAGLNSMATTSTGEPTGNPMGDVGGGGGQ